MTRAGGYDEAYLSCECFWGREPGSYVKAAVGIMSPAGSWRALDLGCGEGKNAAFLASCGATVRAIDCSRAALANGRRVWGGERRISWERGDVARMDLGLEAFEMVVAYGVLHCLASEAEANLVFRNARQAVAAGGLLVICAFNDRAQDLSAHQGFSPLLLAQEVYLRWAAGMEMVLASDADLHETHPHNGIAHCHSMTRLIARKTSER